MINLIKPTQRDIAQFLREQSELPFSYETVGATQVAAPTGFNVDRNRMCIGRGEATYAAACDAIRGWRMFPENWTEAIPAVDELRPGMDVAVLLRCLGIWWINGCRIVYLIDDRNQFQYPKATRRFGFAYGTLPSHAERGEELFAVELDENGVVWYEIVSFSRPRHWLARLAYPLTRCLQKRFARHSMSQLKRILAENTAKIRDHVSGKEA